MAQSAIPAASGVAGPPLRSRLAERVDGASLAIFRMVFGLVITYETINYFRRGWIAEFWINPQYRFTYLGFEWIRPLPEPFLSGAIALLCAAAVAMTAGLFYRWAALSVFLIFTYQFLLESTRYLNHYYAACLFAFLLCIVPAANAWSADRALGLNRGDGTVPLWSIWLLRFQVGVVYVYGGFAKLQNDWLAGQPVESWMARRMDSPFVRFLVDRGWEVAFFSWGGALFDLFIVPLLLWRRTRGFGIVLMLVFHVINSSTFHIGFFPWMMIGVTLIFLDPGWPRALLRRLPGMSGLAAAAPVTQAPDRRQAGPVSKLAFGAMVFYVVFQCVFPARSHLYPGNVLWTEQAQDFSWRMMVREKRGETNLRVETERGVDTVMLSMVLRPWQVQPVSTRPSLTLQLAQAVARRYRENGYQDVRVFADSWVSLNGREPQRMIDPTVDLASQRRSVAGATWILPLAAAPP
jgi:hypothetical protein